MLIDFWTRATFLLASIVARQCSGAHGPKKIQILVPHNIHHHTHTKYTFIPVPVPAPRAANRTDAPPTARPTVLLPVMPVVPLTPTNATPTPTAQPAFQPGQFQPIQPGFLQPQQPAQPPQQPVQPAPAQTPQQQPPPPNSRYILHHNYDHDHDHDHDYGYNDLVGRGSRHKITRADAPPTTHSASMTPIKFKTVINVQETQKIPLPPLPTLMELKQFINEQAKKKLPNFPKLLEFPKLLLTDPPQRIKVDVYPHKDLQLQHMEKILAQWRELQETIRSKPYAGLKQQDLEFDSETAAYKFPPETITEKPEWTALKHLLEKQINSDFPGLKVDAEIKPISYRERSVASDGVGAATEEQPDLRHIGYIVIGNNNQKHFVGVDGTVTTTKT